MSVQKEDVYETEDIPIQEVIDTEEQFEDSAVEKTHVDLEGAIKLFGNRLLNSDAVDFSDALINHRKRRGYRSGHYVLEIVGSENQEKETTEQKIRRIRYEIQELMDNVDKPAYKPEIIIMTKANEDASSISKAELGNLNDILKAALLKKDSKSISVKTPSANEKKPKEDAMMVNAKSPELKELDERITRIEQAIRGQGKQRDRAHHEPLVETVENLRIQVESLNPAYLDGVSTHLNSAILKLSELDDKRSKIHNDEMDQKIDKLYKLVTEWDVVCSNVPTIVKRLQSLSKLHEQAQEFSSKLNDVSGLKQHLEKKTENHKVMLFELKRETMKFVGELSSKMEHLEKRISDIQK